MIKWFQCFVEGDEESVPFRINPDKIFGFKKISSYKTEIYTNVGKFVVSEEYEHFSKRLFTFVEDEETTTTINKKVVVKKSNKCKSSSLEELNFFDTHQPESNC